MAQVSSYNVANRSGALVRSDINDIYSAIKTCNSGPNDPASPEQFMLFGDNTTGDLNLKIHDGSNFRIIGKVTEDNLGLLPRAGGTMTGVLVVSAGSSSAAGLTLGDSSTGLYRQGTNQLNITVSGTRKIDIDSNGLQVRGQADVRFADSDSSHYVALQAPSSVSSSITLTLPSTIVADSFLKTDGSGNLSFGTPDSVPTGCVFCRAIGTVPAGYLECNGAAVSRSTYSVLFGIIQTQYGGGNGSTTFNLPDLRGEFIRGWASNGSVDSGRQIGSSQGSDNLSHNHTISSSVNDSGHSHTIGLAVRSNYAEPRNFGVGRDGNANNSDSTSTQSTGITVSSSAANSGGSEARPRNVAMMYIIKI